MSKTNCINCGAAKDVDEIKCPFCGTTYLDFTSIDFDSGKPVVCNFLLPGAIDQHGNKFVMSMLAVPRLTDVSVHSTYTDVYGGRNDGLLCRVETGRELNIGVEFKPIERHDKNGELCTLTVYKEDE